MIAWALAAIAAPSLPITRIGVVVVAAAAESPSPAFILHNKHDNNPRGIKQRALEVRPRSNHIIISSPSRLLLVSSSGSSNDGGGTNDISEDVTASTKTSTAATNTDPAISSSSLYDVLDVSSTATRAEVKRSYLALAKETHLDALLRQQQHLRILQRHTEYYMIPYCANIIGTIIFGSGRYNI